MSSYRLSPSATYDLDKISDYFADRNPSFGEALLEKLTRQFERLARFPGMGRAAK